MNKKYAIQILEMVERKTLDKKSTLLSEAIRYLERLKIDEDLKNRIYNIKYKNI